MIRPGRWWFVFGSLLLAGPRAAAQSFAAADAVVAAGIRAGVYPGAVLLVGSHDRVLHSRGFGRLTWSARAPAASPDSTVWDLASLTKVVATTPAVMLLVDRGKVDLDAPVVRYLPRFTGAGKDRVTVRMLLDRTSGEPAWLHFGADGAQLHVNTVAVIRRDGVGARMAWRSRKSPKPSPASRSAA